MKFITLLFLLSVTSETFSATITSTHRYSELADGGVSYNEGAGPSFTVTAANMFWSYWGKVTVQSDPGIPIINVSLRFQSDPGQPDVDYHFYVTGASRFSYPYIPVTQNTREHSGTNLGVTSTEFGDINTWEIAWFAKTEWYWWDWSNTTYQTIQGTATLIAETEFGFDELASYPFTYTGGTLVPESSTLGLVALPSIFFIFRRRRALIQAERLI